jgi:hypothetical protein
MIEDLEINSNIICKTYQSLADWNNAKSNLLEIKGELDSANLSILCLNVFGIKSHFDQLLISLTDVKFDVLVLVEASISDNEVSLFNINGYSLFSKLRQERRGGGILLYVSEKYNFVETEFRSVSYENIEGIIKLSNYQTFKLIFVYRPPNLSPNEFLDELQIQLHDCSNVSNLVLGGDMNIDLESYGSSRIREEYEVLLASFGFHRCIFGYTREEIYRNNLVKSCLDHYFIRGVFDKLVSGVIQTKISDHYIIGMDVLIERSNNDRSLHHHASINEGFIRRVLSNIDFRVFYLVYDPEIVYNKIFKLFNEMYNNSFSLSDSISNNNERNNRLLSKSKFRKEWMNVNLLNLIENRDKLFRKWCQSRSVQDRTEYRKYRNWLNSKIKKEKEHYYKTKFSACITDSRKTWNVINELIQRKTKMSVDDIISKNMPQFSENMIADRFACHFYDSVHTLIHNCGVRHARGDLRMRPVNYGFHLPPVSHDFVIKELEKMSLKKSPGFDKIRLRDLLFLKHDMASLIGHLINLIIKKCSIPSKLKISVVRPIHKKGDYGMFSNYRPIAILPVFEKILERHIADKLCRFFKIHNVLCESQYGFIKGLGTDRLLSVFSNHVYSKLQNNINVICLFIDFSKAFDTINHDVLIEKMSRIGFSGPNLTLFKNYLEGRKFIVKIGNSYSRETPLDVGVPQGLSSDLYCFFFM